MKWNKFVETSKKYPLKYPKFVFDPIAAGKLNEGIAILEIENEEPLTNYLLFVLARLQAGICADTRGDKDV